MDTCLTLAFFGYLFRPYNDTVGLSKQSHWMCATFFLAMFLWAIFALVAKDINEVCRMSVPGCAPVRACDVCVLVEGVCFLVTPVGTSEESMGCYFSNLSYE